MPLKKSNKGFNIPSNSCSLLWNNLKSYLLTKMKDGG